MHDLRDEYVELKRPKRDLEAINRVLLDPTIPVTLYTSNRGCFKHRWESEAWQEFQKMSAEEQRPMVEQSMSQIIEKVSIMLVPSKVIAKCATSTARR
jgi:hypothetical protein